MTLLRILSLILTLCAYAWSGRSSATLLYSGGEDIDFTCTTGCSNDTNTGSFRVGWARLSYGLNGTTGDPPTNRFATPTFTANSTLWVHGQFCVLGGNPSSACGSTSTYANVQMLRVFDTSGNPAIVVSGTGTAGQIKISSRTTAGVFTTLATCSAALTYSLSQLDLFINYGTSGEVALYSNSVQVCDFTGDVTNGDGATSLNQVEFSAPSTNWSMWSEIIIATTDTRAMGRVTMPTLANGAATGFSGTNVCSAIWNVNTANDANYGYSGASNVVHECTINSAVPPGSYSVIGFVMSARALVGSSGPLHFDFITRVGGVDYASSDFAPTTSFMNFSNYIQTTNPSTGNPWVVPDFQAAGFNVGEETKP